MKKYYGEEADLKIFEGVYQNAFDYMDKKTKNLGDNIALTIFGEKITYSELKSNIYKYVNKLKNYGLEKGDTFTLVMPNLPETVYYKYAAWVIGAKVNLIDPRFNPEGILTSINMSDSKFAVVVLDAYIPKIVPIIDRMKVEQIVIVNPTDSIDLAKTKNIKSLIAKSLYFSKDIILNLRDKDFRSDRVILNKDFMKNMNDTPTKSIYEEKMDAAIVFTSGTTGTPKGAVLTHDAYNIKVNQVSYGVPKLYPGDTFLAAIPFFSAYGSFAGMHTNLSNGENLVLIPKFTPSEYADLICKYKANTSIGVPKYWEDFFNNFEHNKEKYQLNDLEFILNPVTGGDKIAPEVVEKCNELFKSQGSNSKIIVGYGSSETGGPVITTVNDDEYYDSRSTGVLFPGCKYLFLNPETHEIMPNATDGELCIHDPAMMDRYLNDEEATKAITIYDKDGNKYYKMGDLFSVNEKGMFYFKGRTKRAMMRPDGHTVHANPIEDAIMKHDAVQNVCVVGLSKRDGSSGSIPTAFVILKDGYEKSEELVKEIDEIALNLLSERNRALAYTFTESLPYTLMAKVDYKKLEGIIFEDLETYIVDYTFFPNENLGRTRKKNSKKGK